MTVMHAPEEARTRPIKAVENTFAIIDYLREHGASSMPAIADDLGLAKSTVYKHLLTLKQQGFVVESDHRFSLSYQFLTIGGAIRDQSALCSAAQETLQSLVEDTDHMLLFSLLEGTKGVFVFRINDRLGLGRTIPVGARFHLNQNAAGKAMLAEVDDERMEEIVDTAGLPQETSETISSKQELIDQIAEIRKRGYAVNMGERKSLLWAVSAAVTDPESDAVGAISIGGPASQISEERLHELGEMAKRAAGELELQIRYG